VNSGKEPTRVTRVGWGEVRTPTGWAVAKPVVISGKTGDDAQHYQIKAVKKAIGEAKK
jgi:hypothetical protein